MDTKYMEKETYKIHVECNNCEYKTTHPEEMFEIKKGTTIRQFLERTECPACGCITLRYAL